MTPLKKKNIKFVNTPLTIWQYHITHERGTTLHEIKTYNQNDIYHSNFVLLINSVLYICHLYSKY